MSSQTGEPDTSSTPLIEKEGRRNDSWTLLRWLDYGIKFAVFAVYFSLSISLLAYINLNMQCYVQHTYRQEFASNVVSNPMFSSANVVRRPPLSKLEREYYNDKSRSLDYRQNVSTVIILPAQVHDWTRKAAFLPILPLPESIHAAGEFIPMHRRVDEAYYYDPATGNVSGGLADVDPEEKAATLAAMKSSLSYGYRKDLLRAGAQMPNLARCMRIVKGEDEENNSHKADRMEELVTLQKNSHRLGACLLTGQQATVDITSNYDTSMVLFSSVNVVFMVAMILWISASFALFHLGGWYKTWDELTNPGDESVLDGARSAKLCGCSTVFFDDLLLLLAILWNVIPIFLLLSRDFRLSHSIPMNNALVSIAALLASILLQWKWANFQAFDTATHEMVARRVLQAGGLPPPSSAAERGGRPLPMPLPSALGNAPKPAAAPGGPGEAGPPAVQALFDTSNFLSTASAVRDYGVQYVKAASEAADQQQGLRNRRSAAKSSYEERSYFASPYGRKHERRAILHSTAAAPSYSALIRTGAPFVQYNYVNLIRKEMLLDSAQAIEYTITTPLLFATILAATSPNVSTGLVQWAYGCLAASHLLVVPLMYTGHFYAMHKGSKQSWQWQPLLMSALALLVACAMLQIAGLYIFCSHVWDASSFYSGEQAVFHMARGVLAMQLIYVIFVVSNVASNLFMPDFFSMSQWWMSFVYTVLDVCMKMVLGYVLAVHAENKRFPVLTCSVWDGSYAISIRNATDMSDLW